MQQVKLAEYHPAKDRVYQKERPLFEENVEFYEVLSQEHAAFGALIAKISSEFIQKLHL